MRQPRADKVLLANTRTADKYEEYVPSGPAIEGMRRDLVGIKDYVLHHDLERDIHSA